MKTIKQSPQIAPTTTMYARVRNFQATPCHHITARERQEDEPEVDEGCSLEKNWREFPPRKVVSSLADFEDPEDEETKYGESNDFDDFLARYLAPIPCRARTQGFEARLEVGFGCLKKESGLDLDSQWSVLIHEVANDSDRPFLKIN